MTKVLGVLIALVAGFATEWTAVPNLIPIREVDPQDKAGVELAEQTKNKNDAAMAAAMNYQMQGVFSVKMGTREMNFFVLTALLLPKPPKEGMVYQTWV